MNTPCRQAMNIHNISAITFVDMHFYNIYAMMQVGWVIPNPYLLSFVGTKEAMVLVIRYSGHYSWAHQISGLSCNTGG